jgi:hypothetical protein
VIQNATLDISRARFSPWPSYGEIRKPTFSETLFYAQRFFQKSFRYAIAPAQAVGNSTGEFNCNASRAGVVGNVTQKFLFQTPMRAIGTTTTYNPIAANSNGRDLGAGADAPVTISVDENGCLITFTGAAGTAIGNLLAVHWTVNARL